MITEPVIEERVFNGLRMTPSVAQSELYDVISLPTEMKKGEYDVVLRLKDASNYKWSTTDSDTITLKFVISEMDYSDVVLADTYSDDELQAVKDEIARVDKALQLIANVERVIQLIEALPEEVELSDKETVSLIKDVKEAYDALTDYEKSPIPVEIKEKLDDL